LDAAAEAPLRTAELACAVLPLAEQTLGFTKAALATDLGSASEFAAASLAAAALNVRVNHRSLPDGPACAQREARLAALETEAAAALARIRAALRRDGTRA
ncbi:MAG: cyclodeaminase/cyclohydrolase family protein, partial [Vulcanimicrobiaceae bacterium]